MTAPVIGTIVDHREDLLARLRDALTQVRRDQAECGDSDWHDHNAQCLRGAIIAVSQLCRPVTRQEVR